MFEKIKRLFIGKILRTDQLSHEKFNVFWGMPILSSDTISSVAYASEEILYVLLPVIGLMAYQQMFYVAMAIILLLCMLVFSYRQTIDNYPCGGGSYIVAMDNLGVLPGLTAAATLSIDYILTVAVSTSAGTAAITSAFPSLLEHKVAITLLLILILTIGNLRGIHDSSRLFGCPTYLFILTAFIMIAYGIFKVQVLGEVPQATRAIPIATGEISVFLLLRSFASGCTALTGVEAVSNGIPNFRNPCQANAKNVLTIMALVVLVIFGGTSYLATIYHAVPNPDETIISQIATQVFGVGFMFYAIQITTALILIMAANTAFSDLPLLLSILASNGYAPRQLAKRGERLSFSNGIILLALSAGLLIVLFQGETHLLMPLYAVGVFASFTLSQSGMFRRWLRTKTPGWHHKAFVNGLGAVVTFTTLLIIIVTKFLAGAWIVCLLIPALIYVMLKIKGHYNFIARGLSLPLEDISQEICAFHNETKHVVILLDTLNKASLRALLYAKGLSESIVAFHVSIDDEATAKLKRKWEQCGISIPLIIKQSPYRDIVQPLLEYLESEEHASAPGDMITVVLPQFVVGESWQNILHNQTAAFIRKELMRDTQLAIVVVPYVMNK